MFKISTRVSYLISFLIVLIMSYNSETRAQYFPCGVADLNPSQVQLIRDQINQYLALGKRPLSEILTIPVAVHIIRYDAGQHDISDLTIASQIDVLNACYSGTNFQFTLLSTDRTDNRDWTMHCKDSQEEREMKINLAVDPRHVLNIYFCWAPCDPVHGEILGYARFPWEYTSENNSMHGVVIRSSTVPGGTYEQNNEGKTTVHEIGHYLGLYHTFQNFCDYPGDEVNDTPYEGEPNTEGCVDSRNTCPDSAGNDPIHNYMDYSDDYCRYEFTLGQSDLMNLMVPTFRPSLYNVSVVVEQQSENGSLMNGSTISRWENDSTFVDYTVPVQPYTLTVGNQVTFRGQQTPIASPDEKYHQWKINNTANDNVENHHTFTVTSDMSNLTSKFTTTYSGVEITNFLISAAGNDSGKIWFKDPWFIDYSDPQFNYNLRNRGMKAEGPDKLEFYERTSPFHPDFNTFYSGIKYLGVFLNQGLVQGNWIPPYYLVAVPSTQIIPFHGKDITWYFQGWSGHADSIAFQYPGQTETAVVFKTNNAVAKANYKGHGASSSAIATGYNNGRKIVYKYYAGQPAIYHMVYADYNGVWYTRSTDGGVHWTQELLLSTPNTINMNPSIALSENYTGYFLYVVWEQLYSAAGVNNLHRILARKITVDGYGNITLGDIQNISREGGNPIGTFDSKNEARPTVYAESLENIWVAWRAKLVTDSTYNKVFIKCYSTSGGWSYAQQVSTVDGFPVIARSPSGSNRIKIVYSDGVKIKYIAGNYSGSTWTWTSIVTLKDDSPAYYLTQPTFVIDTNNYGHLVYCGYYIYYVKYNLANPAAPVQVGSTVSLSTYDCSSPSISVVGSGGSQVITVFFSKTGVIYRKKYQNSSWTSTNFADGKYPSLAEKSTAGAAWTRFTSVPYILKTDLGDGILHKSVGPLEVECIIAKRFEYPEKGQNDPDKRLIIDLENFSVDGTSYLFDDNLETDQITLSGSNKIEMQWQVQNSDLKQDMPLLRLYFKTETDKYLLQTFNSAELLNKSSENLQNISSTLDFNCKESLTGRIVIEFIDTLPYHVNLLKGGEDDVSMAKSSTSEAISWIVPKEFSLRQNFPNPFNPNTQISYELPTSVNVSLKIYNTNGQLVSELVNGFKDAGRYQVVFDGSYLASGIYFYRLEAGKFSAVKRMVLIK